jgi:hypothetical protein
MIKIHDNIFDRKWLDEVTDRLIEAPWYANNTANNDTWPYGRQGTHRILGDCFFDRQSENHIRYNQTDLEFGNALINSFDHIQHKVGRKMRLIEIFTNLQFAGMDGTIHVDGSSNQSAFILMLSNEHHPENIGGGFYHKPTDTTVDYKYGRLIEITASDAHKGLAFTKPYVARMSVKYLGLNL